MAASASLVLSKRCNKVIIFSLQGGGEEEGETEEEMTMARSRTHPAAADDAQPGNIFVAAEVDAGAGS
jgi:hypothetical protein